MGTHFVSSPLALALHMFWLDLPWPLRLCLGHYNLPWPWHACVAAIISLHSLATAIPCLPPISPTHGMLPIALVMPLDLDVAWPWPCRGLALA